MPACHRLVLLGLLLCLPSACLGAGRGFTPAPMPQGPLARDYLRILSRFPLYAERGWHDLDGQPGVGWFGDGRSDENGQRTLANFILVYALLATDPGYDPAVSGCSREHLQGRALAAARYWLRTHFTQDLRCADGRAWGSHWQSPWWTSKALTGIRLLWEHLSNQELERLQRVVTSEADQVWIRRLETNEYGDTRAEENAWSSEILAWALCLYPNHAHASYWQERFTALCLNTICVPADLEDARQVAGRTVQEWVVGSNAHPDFTIENHGFFHPCYLACPLHSLAWDVYVFRAFGRHPPAEVSHHVADLWTTLYRFALWEGRFAYPAGKDWPRYAYGLYFMLPALVVEQQYRGDRVARLIETERVATIEREQCHWADGSFFSGRFTHGRMEGWPAEWESDCACMLAMAYLLHRQAGTWPRPASPHELDTRAGGVLISPECGQVSLRGPNRFASVSYRARGTGLQVTFGARGAEDMLEWDGNLAGRLVTDFGEDRSVVRQAAQAVSDGFVTAARIFEGTRWEVARSPDGSPVLDLRLSDANSTVGQILAPDHPLFTTPHRITSLEGMATLDSVEQAAPGWQVLASDVRGRPALLEAAVGRGRLLVSMAGVAEAYLAGKPAGLVFENAVALLAAHGPLGYLAVESLGRQALEKAGARFRVITEPQGEDLAQYGAIFVDRSSDPRLAAAWPYLMQYVRQGGLLFKLCLQDSGWNPEWLSIASVSHAFQHDLLVAALPDDRTLLYWDRWTALSPVSISRQEGLGWHIANDLFNGNHRHLRFAGGEMQVIGMPAGPDRERWQPLPGRWLNVDGRVGLAVLLGEGQMMLCDRAARRGGAASICFEDVYFPWSDQPRSCPSGEVAQETIVALLARTGPDATARYAAAHPVTVEEHSADRLALRVVAPDGQAFLVTADFGLGRVGMRTLRETPPAKRSPA